MSDSVSVSCPHCLVTNRVPAVRLDNGPKCGRCHKPLYEGEPVQLNDSWLNTFIAKNETPLLVDFWAPWCGPCLQMEPAFAAAASRLEPKVRVARINTEQNVKSSAQYNIRSIPTLVLFDGQKIIARRSGVMSTEQIVTWVESALALPI